MVILAIYYAIADFVLLGQCFYYRGFTWRDDVPDSAADFKSKRKPSAIAINDERTALLSSSATIDAVTNRERRGSDWSANLSHLSPAVPLVSDTPPLKSRRTAPSTLQAVLFNGLAILMVCAAGVGGWWLSRKDSVGHEHKHSEGAQDGGKHAGGDELTLDLWGQIFGWLCAALYLGSRLPQLLLNWRRQSTEGVSMLFFLFACLGNLTYVLSIVAYDPDARCASPDQCAPGEAASIYGRWMLLNLSWLAGSAGTLLLDLGIFAQFFMYGKNTPEERVVEVEDGYDTEIGDEEHSIDGDRWDHRPVLERHDSH
jgi:hypothetical protein